MTLSELASFAISGSAATTVSTLITDRAVSSDRIVGPTPTKLSTTAGNGFVFFLSYYVAATAGPRLLGRQNPDGPSPASTRSAATQAFFVGATAAVCTRLLGPREDFDLHHENDTAVDPQAPIPPYQEPLQQSRWSRSALQDDLVLALDPGLTFCIHELLARAVAQRQWKRHTSRRQQASGLSAAVTTFLLAATSKAIATGVTFPLYAAATASEAARRRPVLIETDENGNGETKILSMLWKTLRHPGGLRALYDGWLRNVTAASFGHGLTMALQRVLFGVILRLIYSLTKTLRKRLGNTSSSRTAVPVNTELPREAPRSSSEKHDNPPDVFADEREKVTKAVETWLESTTEGSDTAPSKIDHEIARLLPSSKSTTSPKTVVSSHHTFIEDQLPVQDGNLPTSPDDMALVRYDATRRAKTVVSRAKTVPSEVSQRTIRQSHQPPPRSPFDDTASRAPPTESGVDVDGDNDGAGSVIFNMISKSPRVVKRRDM